MEPCMSQQTIRQGALQILKLNENFADIKNGTNNI